MKRLISSILGAGTIAASSFIALAGDDEHREHAMKPAPTNASFELIKSLAGEWTAVDEAGKKTDERSEFRVTAGGSAVMEILFKGQPHEMVTMYYLEGEDIVLTHYCVLHNQPTMRLQRDGSAGVLAFEFDGGSNIDLRKDDHMHSAVFTIADKDHFSADWTMYHAGEADHTKSFQFVRTK